MNGHRIRHRHQRKQRYDEDEDYNQFSGMMDYDDMGDDDENMEESDDGEEKYSEKKQLVALLLSAFLGPVGAGRFYAGEYVGASLKLCLFLLAPCGICVFACCVVGGAWRGANQDDENDAGLGAMLGGMAGGGLGLCCVCLLGCAITIWQITDIILFAMNDIPDGNGLTLKPM